MSKKQEYCEIINKSTVINMRDNFDWGRILFDACYMFNYTLAEHWLQYIKIYNHLNVNIQKEIDELSVLRDSIICKKDKLKEDKKNLVQQANIFYKQYTKALPIGTIIKNHRKNCANVLEVQELIRNRKDAKNQYYAFVDKSIQAINEEKQYNKTHLFETRNLGTKVRTLTNLVNIHGLELAHPIINDKDIIYNLLISEEQAERLMGVCINILNTYSEKEFSTSLNLQDREKIADNIYEYFSSFEHNYDFITGCYKKEEDNKLHLKDIEQLKSKLYNGYYFTIRGFVQRSYISARDEKYNIESVDAVRNGNENQSNQGFDNYVSVDENNSLNGGYSVYATNAEMGEFGEGMIDFWHECQKYLINNVDDMANELFQQMKITFPKMTYYVNMNNNQIMVNLILNTLKGIDEELKRGRNVSSKLKHIILDSMGGAETKKEWKYCVDYTSDVIMKYINKFFFNNNIELQEN